MPPSLAETAELSDVDHCVHGAAWRAMAQHGTAWIVDDWTTVLIRSRRFVFPGDRRPRSNDRVVYLPWVCEPYGQHPQRPRPPVTEVILVFQITFFVIRTRFMAVANHVFRHDSRIVWHGVAEWSGPSSDNSNFAGGDLRQQFRMMPNTVVQPSRDCVSGQQTVDAMLVATRARAEHHEYREGRL